MPVLFIRAVAVVVVVLLVLVFLVVVAIQHTFHLVGQHALQLLCQLYLNSGRDCGADCSLPSSCFAATSVDCASKQARVR